MLPLIIGGVTLAVVGYAIKEVCEEDGCPWDDKLSDFEAEDEERQENAKVKNSTKAKEFHKFKKNIYNTSMQEYQEFLKKHNLQNNDIEIDRKLEKQKFHDEQISDELESYITQISNTLEILSYNLSLAVKLTVNEKNMEDDDIDKIKSNAENIYTLSHLELFDKWKSINKVEILSVLVNAMGKVTQKNTIHVDLSVA